MQWKEKKALTSIINTNAQKGARLQVPKTARCKMKVRRILSQTLTGTMQHVRAAQGAAAPAAPILNRAIQA